MGIKSVKMRAHTRDCFDVELLDSNDKILHEESGYIPSWMPGKEYGDIILTIDNETGRILNWKPIELDNVKSANEYE